MNNVKITPEMLSANEQIPEEIRPKRFAIATNYIICFKKPNAGIYFLLFNYEPQKWNQWYPYFYSTNGTLDCNVNTYSELMTEFQKLSSTYPQISSRFETGKQSLSDLLGTNDVIEVNESPIETEYWIKYSKTQNVWTFYQIEFVQIIQLPKIDYSEIDSVELLPLDEKTITSVLTTGKYHNIPVVDNTLDILKDEGILSKLFERAILME